MCRIIGVRCFSEPGEGKDQIDANGAIIKRGLASKLDEGYDLECAEDLLRHASCSKVPGQRFGIIKVHRENENSIPGRSSVPHISNYALWVIDENEITFYESLDSSASRESISNGGKAVGFGEGVKMSISDFNKKHSTQLEATGATLELTSSSGYPKQRPSREEKRDAHHAHAAKKSEKARAAKEMKAAASRATEAHYDDAAEQCPRCKKCFLTPGWYSRKTSHFCPNRSELLESRKRARRVDIILQAHDAVTLQEHRERLSHLRDVCVKLRGAGRVGLTVNPRTHAVTELEETGISFLSGKIGKDFLLMSIDGEPVTTNSLAILNAKLSSNAVLTLMFKRPQPLLPFHGIARKGIHKSVQYSLHVRQLEWLNANAFVDGQTRLRDKPATQAMKAHFCNTMREDTMTPMWLDQERISSWLAARVKEEKNRRKAGRAATFSHSGSASATHAAVSYKKRGRCDEESNEESDEELSSAKENSLSSESDADESES
jgi:hypothetical protein